MGKIMKNTTHKMVNGQMSTKSDTPKVQPKLKLGNTMHKKGCVGVGCSC